MDEQTKTILNAEDWSVFRADPLPKGVCEISIDGVLYTIYGASSTVAPWRESSHKIVRQDGNHVHMIEKYVGPERVYGYAPSILDLPSSMVEYITYKFADQDRERRIRKSHLRWEMMERDARNQAVDELKEQGHAVRVLEQKFRSESSAYNQAVAKRTKEILDAMKSAKDMDDIANAIAEVV